MCIILVKSLLLLLGQYNDKLEGLTGREIEKTEYRAMTTEMCACGFIQEKLQLRRTNEQLT